MDDPFDAAVLELVPMPAESKSVGNTEAVDGASGEDPIDQAVLDLVPTISLPDF